MWKYVQAPREWINEGIELTVEAGVTVNVIWTETSLTSLHPPFITLSVIKSMHSNLNKSVRVSRFTVDDFPAEERQQKQAFCPFQKYINNWLLNSTQIKCFGDFNLEIKIGTQNKINPSSVLSLFYRTEQHRSWPSGNTLYCKSIESENSEHSFRFWRFWSFKFEMTADWCRRRFWDMRSRFWVVADMYWMY